MKNTRSFTFNTRTTNTKEHTKSTILFRSYYIITALRTKSDILFQKISIPDAQMAKFPLA